MPTYEYECSKCGVHFDRFEAMSAEPQKTCPECGGKVRRVPTAPIGILMGGGSSPMRECPNCPDAGSCCAGGACDLDD